MQYNKSNDDNNDDDDSNDDDDYSLSSVKEKEKSLDRTDLCPYGIIFYLIIIFE